MNQKKLKITILLLALVQMGPIFMAPIINILIEQFPQYQPSFCQMLMTFPNLVVVLMSILTGKFDAMITKRHLTVFACLSILLGGLGLFLYHTQLCTMFIFSGLIGVGVGILLSLTATIISQYFTPDQQGKLYGLQNAFTSVGGVLLNLLGGFLASIAWYFDFLAPLFIIIPALIMSLIAVPNEKGQQPKKIKNKQKLPSLVYFYCLIAFIFTLVFNTMPTNLAIFISERQLGNSSFSGIITAAVLCGGAAAGMFFNQLNQKIGEKTIAVGFFNLSAGLLIASQATSAPVLFIGALVGGCSISLLMSQLTLSTSTKIHPLVTPMAMSLLMAANNLGNFISPFIFSLLPGQTVAQRFFLIAIFGFIIAGGLALILKNDAHASLSNSEI